MSLPLNSSSRWLFIGDSITDCGRRKCDEEIGDGYVHLIRDWLRVVHLGDAPRIINRGISGNNVSHLAERWEPDALASSPDVLSIKIGINDVWSDLKGGRGVPINIYRETYHGLLEQTRRVLPDCRIVLCEPSVISPPAPEPGNERLQPYIQAVRELAGQFQAETVVPLHGAFVRAAQAAPDIQWTRDGVHPTSSGHMLIAREWLAATGLL